MVSGRATLSICPAISACAVVLSSSNRVMRVPGTAALFSALSWLDPRFTPTVLPFRSSSVVIAVPFLAMIAIWKAL